MSNPVNKIVDVVEGLNKKVQDKVNDVSDSVDATGKRVLDKVDLVGRKLAEPLDEAENLLDSLLKGDNAEKFSDEEVDDSDPLDRQ